MVVDDFNRQDANPVDLAGRLLGHELGHALSLPHGDGKDNPGPEEQCENGILDDEDEECEGLSQFDGPNLMQYRNDTELTPVQVGQLRYHIVTTVPDFQVDPETSSLADILDIEDERAQVLDFERAQVLDFERAQVLDFERAQVLDFERAQVLDFETEEVLDFGFLDVVDFGMQFGATDTTVYASVGGLAWPTPIRPATVYLWYLDLDEDDLTGATPADYGYPGGLAQELGVDLIVQVDLYSECDANNVCNDFVVERVFDWDDVNLDGFDLVYGPVQALDFVEGVTVGLVQSTVNPERDDPAVGMIIRPTLPSSLMETAIPGHVFVLGDTVAMEVITAIPCEVPLPNGIVLDCQCTNCDDCQDYPGCAAGGIDPAPQSQCTVSGTLCVTDADCTGAGDPCSGTESLIVADEPGGVLEFEPPVLPSSTAEPPVAEPGDVITIVASDFPTDTGQPMTVLLDGEVIGGTGVPVFDPDGRTTLTATIPGDAPYGDLELTIVLDGFATASVVVVTIGAPPAVVETAAPLDPVQESSVVTLTAEFVDNEGETHTAEWDWGDGAVTSGTVTEPTQASPGTVTDSHTYADPGVYTATLTITDSKFNSTQQVFPFIVVYDPEGGFVTGGGWIHSPPGAYPADPIMTGSAEFGFVSKYKKDATAPMGETEFEFEVAGLHFHSDTYEWLVIAGAQAMFRGSGTVNGEGDYGFMLTAVDEKLTPSTNEDLFRIKIWDKNDNDALVYDNEMDDEEDARPDTALGGGSIVIHTKK
jgi:hypothetical protein